MKKLKFLGALAVLVAAAMLSYTSSNGRFNLDTKNNTSVSVNDVSVPLVDEFKSDLNHFLGIVKTAFGLSSTSTSPTDDQNGLDVTQDVATTEGLQIVSDTSLQQVSLVRVVDGDTLVVNDGENDFYVRLIGIDTPESVNPDEAKNTAYGEIASTFTKELLKNTATLWLQYDIEPTDKYGRTLAYVWLKAQVDISSTTDIENYMVNGIILRNGFAVDKIFLPNATYADVFSEIRQRAEDGRCGLWNVEGYDALIYG